jgi:hypothetical protein
VHFLLQQFFNASGTAIGACGIAATRCGTKSAASSPLTQRGRWLANQHAVEPRPIEERPGVCLAARCDVGVANDIFDRVVVAQNLGQGHQASILWRSERGLVAAFKLDANREIVAALPRAPLRNSSVPSAHSTWHELDHLAPAANQEVRRNAQRLDFPIVGMLFGIEAVGKQSGDAVAAKLPWRQADGVDDQQSDRFIGRPVVAIR